MPADKPDMPERTMILNSGGLRSLVATGVVVSEVRASQICLLHFDDHLPSSGPRLDCASKQASHYEIDLIELKLPPLSSNRELVVPPEQKQPALFQSQVLLLGLAQGVEWQASRLVWAIQFNAVFNTCARATEQVILAQSLAQLERSEVPDIETPLLELDDQQVVELGGQLDVPWETGWTCQLRGERPCRVCPACRRRHTAFDAAGMVDAIDAPVASTAPRRPMAPSTQ